MLVLRLPTLAEPGGPSGNGWIAIFVGLFFVPCTHATGVVGTSQVLTRPDLEPWHCQAGRRPLQGLVARSLRGGHREVLVVVGTCGGFPVFIEVPSTSACSLDLPRPCRNRFAPSACGTRVAVRGCAVPSHRAQYGAGCSRRQQGGRGVFGESTKRVSKVRRFSTVFDGRSWGVVW